jgi:hypothetical protein
MKLPERCRWKTNIQVYHQLAQITIQLSNLRFPQIGPIYPDDHGHFRVRKFVDAHGLGYGLFDTAVDYFKHRVEEIVSNIETWIYRKKFESKAGQENAAKMCRLLEQVGDQLSDHDYGSFPLTHGDFWRHPRGGFSWVSKATTRRKDAFIEIVLSKRLRGSGHSAIRDFWIDSWRGYVSI